MGRRRAPIVREDLSYCVLWAPLPPITWFCPVIGHMGIADGRGVASDFQGKHFFHETCSMLTVRQFHFD